MIYAYIRFDSEADAEAFSVNAFTTAYPNSSETGRKMYPVFKITENDPWVVLVANADTLEECQSQSSVAEASNAGLVVEYYDESVSGNVSQRIYSGQTAILN